MRINYDKVADYCLKFAAGMAMGVTLFAFPNLFLIALAWMLFIPFGMVLAWTMVFILSFFIADIERTPDSPELEVKSLGPILGRLGEFNIHEYVIAARRKDNDLAVRCDFVNVIKKDTKFPKNRAYIVLSEILYAEPETQVQNASV